MRKMSPTRLESQGLFDVPVEVDLLVMEKGEISKETGNAMKINMCKRKTPRKQRKKQPEP